MIHGVKGSVQEEIGRGNVGHLSDEALLLAYATSRDSRLFDELVRRYERGLLRYLRRMLGDLELARDALQATWLQLHLKCHLFGEDQPLRPWLYTVAANQAIDASRVNRRHRLASIDGSDCPGQTGKPLVERIPAREVEPPVRAERCEQRADIRRAVNRLPIQLRQLVFLIFFEGLKYRDAAQRLGIPEGTVKSRMHRAFSKLHQGLQLVAASNSPA